MHSNAQHRADATCAAAESIGKGTILASLADRKPLRAESSTSPVCTPTRVNDQEFYQLLDRDGITENIHLFNDKLREWEDYSNYHRPHGALDGKTPYERHGAG